ncbi:MAG: DUF6048 family protein [Prevotella sp.]
MSRSSISLFISKSIAISLFFLLTSPALAQERQQKKVMASSPEDSIPLFRGVQIMGDVVGLVQYAVSDYGQYEVGARVNLKDRYFPIVEIGLGKADHDDAVTAIHYKTSAPYGKVGMDFNLLKNKHDIYRLYAGFRYAYTSFKFDVYHPDLVDPVWGGSTPFDAHDVKASYGWLEGVVGVDAKIWGPFHLGWTVRYKRRLNHNDSELGNVWYVPGFGKQGSTRLGGTFNVIIEI